MLTEQVTKGIYLDVPEKDWALFNELIRKFGWHTRTKEQVLERFIATRPKKPLLSEEDIMAEVNAVRYAK
jgi:hypothetical protein